MNTAINPGELVKLPDHIAGRWTLYSTLDTFFQIRNGTSSNVESTLLGIAITTSCGYAYVIFPETMGWIGGAVVERA